MVPGGSHRAAAPHESPPSDYACHLAAVAGLHSWTENRLIISSYSRRSQKSHSLRTENNAISGQVFSSGYGRDGFRNQSVQRDRCDYRSLTCCLGLHRELLSKMAHRMPPTVEAFALFSPLLVTGCYLSQRAVSTETSLRAYRAPWRRQISSDPAVQGRSLECEGGAASRGQHQ